jgi:hypothetical protein
MKCRSLATLAMTFLPLGMTMLPAIAGAQSDGDIHLNRLLALPVGAMPPVAILMPASRNHNYLVTRVQGGRLMGSKGDRDAVGAGLDIQWRGGSIFGLTAGYQKCDVEAQCPSHMMYGGRANLNLITGGPTFAALIGDASATTTVGTQFGFGYAPKALDDRNACAFDVGLPVSISMFQKIRVVAFGSPGVAWDVRCPSRGGTPGVAASTYAQAGIGLQQLGARGLDVTIGAQQIFRRGAGVHLGISVTYVRLP